MVARPGQYQSSFNSGELGRDAQGRVDIKQYYSGAGLMQNVEPVPQGGFAQAPGSRQIAPVRGLLAEAPSALYPNLGPHSTAVVIAIAYVAVIGVSAVDVFGLSLPYDAPGMVQIEVSADSVTWVPLGAPLSVGPVPSSRRRAFAPGTAYVTTAVRLRLLYPPAPAATFGLSGLRVMYEAAPVTVARDFEFTYSSTEAYIATFTQGNVDLYDGDTYVGAAYTPIVQSQLADLKREQRLDTMVVFHPDLTPQRIMRRANTNDWSCDDAPFENVPLTDYGAVYGNVVTDWWRVNIDHTAGPAGLGLDMNINGEDIATVFMAAGPDYAGFAAALKTAIEALPSVAPGITIVLNAFATSFVMDITFTGTGNVGQRFALTAKIAVVTFATATASHVVIGDPGGEAIMSVLRGWPTTGAFYQDRLYAAGFKGVPGALLGSNSGEYFDLNTRIENAAGGLLVRIDTSGAERIEHLVRAKHLVVFTNEAEYFISDRAIVRTTPPNVAESSRNGVAPGIRPLENDGGILYVGASRKIVYAATYSDVAQSYESEPISLLASHLIDNITSAALQRASASNNAARYYLTREDGLLVVGVMIRNQDIIAFTRFQTDGLVRDVCVDGANRAYIQVLRNVGGLPRLVKERLEAGLWLHQAKSFSYGAPTTVISGLDLMDGAAVWAICDGYVSGPYTVTTGYIVVPEACTTATVGRWTPPILDTLPPPRLVSDRIQVKRPMRVHTVRCQLEGTSSLAIGANGRPAKDVALLRGGDVSDQPVQPVTGPVTVAGLSGFSDEGIARFTQIRPGDLRIRDITIEAKT